MDGNFEPNELAAQRVPTIMRGTNYEDLMLWAADCLQDVEDIVANTGEMVPLRFATGSQLDSHGSGVLLKRNGLVDDHYRLALIVRNVALFRHRTPDLVQEISQILTEGAEVIGYTEFPPASYRLTLTNITNTRAVLFESLLRTAKPEGVRLRTDVVESPLTAFRYDAGPGYDVGVYAYSLDSSQ